MCLLGRGLSGLRGKLLWAIFLAPIFRLVVFSRA